MTNSQNGMKGGPVCWDECQLLGPYHLRACVRECVREDAAPGSCFGFEPSCDSKPVILLGVSLQ